MKHIILLALLISYSLQSQNEVFNPESSKLPLYQYASFTNAGNSNYNLKTLQKDSTLIYKPLLSDNHSVGFTSDNYWVRFKMANTQTQEQTYYLETARPVTDIATLFQVSETNTQIFKSGDQIPFKNRQVNHRSTVFKIILPANSVKQFYLHLKSDGETINLPLNLYTESEFLQKNYNQQLFLGLFYGVLLLAGIIYLFFYVSLKERSFLYYGLYVFSLAFLQAALDGLMFEFIWPESGYFNSRAVLITALFSNFFLLKYCEYFLNIKDHFKAIKKYYNLIYLVLAVLFVFVFINDFTLKITYPISNVNGLISLLLIFFTVFVMRYKRVAIDSFFAFGILFLVIGLLGFVMNNLSLLPNNFYTLNSAKFGAGLEVLFLSLSMTNLIRKLREEKELSQALALKKSEEISALKTYFMSHMSHELRTPLNAILGIAQNQIEQDAQKADSKSNYKIIENASISLLSNINDILDFEKIEKNELTLKKEPFNPKKILDQISANWKIQAESKGLSYKLDIPKHMPNQVLGDPDRFGQIVNNVIGNAVKFTTSGTVSLLVQGSHQPNNTYRFAFQVSDTGVGIPESLLPDIFDSFSQMRNNNKRQHGGIGLGLTIVKYLVDRFGGSVNIESKTDVGTDVFIDIPMQIVEQKEIKPVLNMRSDSASSCHILIVEDNKMNQMILKKLLASNSNFTFEVADNGSIAIDKLKAKTFDIVLMDLQMPVMDGYEATKIIRSGQLNKTIKDLPIIAVTADALQETREKAIKVGMSDYITKPIDKQKLFKKINYHALPLLQPA